MWPFIPWVKRTYSRNPVIYLAGGLFHLALFTVLILGTAHMLVWKSLLGFGWPTLPLPIVDWMAAVGIVAMLGLLIHRIVNPVMKLITGLAEWTNWSLVFLPMVTGYIMTHHLFFRYEVLFSLHMLAWIVVDLDPVQPDCPFHFLLLLPHYPWARIWQARRVGIGGVT